MKKKIVENIQQDIWLSIKKEAKMIAKQEPLLAFYLYKNILSYRNFESALAYRLTVILENRNIKKKKMFNLLKNSFKKDCDIIPSAIADIQAIKERDPACEQYIQPLLYFKGYQSLQAFRVAHCLWHHGDKHLALYLQSIISEKLGVDIHPAAKIGKRIFFDHATGIVVGETAIIEDNVSILQEVTLGGTGKQTGDRHPKIRQGVLIGAGSKILGNIEIGTNAKIGAGSVVLEDVPPYHTAVGVPAVLKGSTVKSDPSNEMNHQIE